MEETTPKNRVKEFISKNPILTAVIVLGIIVTVGYNIFANNRGENAAPAPQATKVIAGSTSTDTATAAETEPTAAPTTALPTDIPQLSPGNSPQAPTVEADWRPVAEEFAKAYTNKDGGRDAWLERLRPLVDDVTYSAFENYEFDRDVYSATYQKWQGESYDGAIVETKLYYEEAPSAPVTITLAPNDAFEYKVIMVD